MCTSHTVDPGVADWRQFHEVLSADCEYATADNTFRIECGRAAASHARHLAAILQAVVTHEELQLRCPNGAVQAVAVALATAVYGIRGEGPYVSALTTEGGNTPERENVMVLGGTPESPADAEAYAKFRDLRWLLREALLRSYVLDNSKWPVKSVDALELLEATADRAEFSWGGDFFPPDMDRNAGNNLLETLETLKEAPDHEILVLKKAEEEVLFSDLSHLVTAIVPHRDAATLTHLQEQLNLPVLTVSDADHLAFTLGEKLNRMKSRVTTPFTLVVASTLVPETRLDVLHLVRILARDDGFLSAVSFMGIDKEAHLTDYCWSVNLRQWRLELVRDYFAYASEDEADVREAAVRKAQLEGLAISDGEANSSEGLDARQQLYFAAAALAARMGELRREAALLGLGGSSDRTPGGSSSDTEESSGRLAELRHELRQLAAELRALLSGDPTGNHSPQTSSEALRYNDDGTPRRTSSVRGDAGFSAARYGTGDACKVCDTVAPTFLARTRFLQSAEPFRASLDGEWALLDFWTRFAAGGGLMAAGPRAVAGGLGSSSASGGIGIHHAGAEHGRKAFAEHGAAQCGGAAVLVEAGSVGRVPGTHAHALAVRRSSLVEAALPQEKKKSPAEILADGNIYSPAVQALSQDLDFVNTRRLFGSAALASKEHLPYWFETKALAKRGSGDLQALLFADETVALFKKAEGDSQRRSPVAVAELLRKSGLVSGRERVEEGLRGDREREAGERCLQAVSGIQFLEEGSKKFASQNVSRTFGVENLSGAGAGAMTSSGGGAATNSGSHHPDLQPGRQDQRVVRAQARKGARTTMNAGDMRGAGLSIAVVEDGSRSKKGLLMAPAAAAVVDLRAPTEDPLATAEICEMLRHRGGSAGGILAEGSAAEMQAREPSDEHARYTAFAKTSRVGRAAVRLLFPRFFLALGPEQQAREFMEKNDLKEFVGPDKKTKFFGCNLQSANCAMDWLYKGWAIPPCCRETLKQLLFFVDELFTEHRIRYIVTDGALLGALKTGGLLNWDGDVDLHVEDSGFARIEGLRPLVEARGYGLRLHERGESYLLTANKHNYLLIELNMRREAFPEFVWKVELDGGVFPVMDYPGRNATEWYGEGIFAHRLRYVPPWEEDAGNFLFCSNPGHWNCAELGLQSGRDCKREGPCRLRR